MSPHAQDNTIIALLITTVAGIVTQVLLLYLKNKKDSEDKAADRQWQREEAERKARLTEHRHEEITQKLDVNTQITQAAATKAAKVETIVATALAPTAADTNVQAHAIREKVEEIADGERPNDTRRG